MRSFAKIIIVFISLCCFAILGDYAMAKSKQHKSKHKVTHSQTTKKSKKTKKAKSLARSLVSSPATYSAAGLTAVINHAISDVDPNLNIGIVVKSMKYGDVLYTRNAQKTFVPASILKVFTAEAALLYLGSDYKFQTNFYTDSPKINNGVINGNLYLVHSGDPSLTYKDLIELMDTLKAQQIHQINGNVYIDTTAYDDINYGPGWIWDDTRYCYAAPISASIINHNCLSFHVAPGKAVGNAANIIENSNFFYTPIQNSVTTKPANTRSCYIRLTTNPDSTIFINGCLPKGHYGEGISTVISDVIEYNKALLRTLFRRSGVQVLGNISSGTAPAKLTIVASHVSKPLHELLTEMLKKSDNIIAGSVFKKLGETYTKKPGSWENGSVAVSKILAKTAGVNTSDMNVLDGSGLSRFNKITPKQMLHVLDFAYHNNATNYDFISGLPVAGVDGTLKHRLGNIAWKVRAKTGTMKGVNALAGYAMTRDKEPLAFVIIVNGQHSMGWRYKELEDVIVTALTKYSR